MTNHQQAAIDAAAISLRQIEPNLYQNPANPQRYYGGLAQDVLAAAEPHLRKKWAEEIRNGVNTPSGAPAPGTRKMRREALRDGMNEAARIAEGKE